MKKIILVTTSLLLTLSSYSYAEQTNYFVQQEAKQKTQISHEQSPEKPFITQHLNTNPRINNK